MNKHFKFITAFMMCAMMVTGFSACSDDDDPVLPNGGNGEGEKPQTTQVVKVVLSRKTDYGNDWIYFSLKDGKELAGIDESNRMENHDWDLAFNRYNVRTNSGKSGSGKGGVMDTGKTHMAEVTEVPAGEFTVDVMGEITKDMSGFPPPSMESPLNEVLGEAIFFQGPPPEYIPNNHIYIVRTADGKYAKVKITGFHNDRGQSGYVNFEYQYQANGSKKF